MKKLIAVLLLLSLTLLSCKDTYYDIYGVAVEKSIEPPMLIEKSKGRIDRVDAEYYVIFLDTITDRKFRLDVTVPDYYDIEIGKVYHFHTEEYGGTYWSFVNYNGNLDGSRWKFKDTLM